MYTDGDDEEAKSVPGIVFLEMSRHSSDALKNYLPEILPLAFVGRKDPNEAIANVWVQVWDDNTSGMTAAVKLYTTELVNLCSNLLSTNPSWTIKKQVGSAIGDLAKSVGESIGDSMSQLLPLLKESLSGRTWDGKEAVLEGLLEVTEAGKSYFAKPENAKTLAELAQIVIREGKKNNLQYKKYSIEYMGRFFDIHDINRFEDIEEYLFETAEKDEMDEDSDVDEAKLKPLVLVIRANAFKAIGKAFPKDKQEQVKQLKPVLERLLKDLDFSIWNIKLAIVEAVETLITKVSAETFDQASLETASRILFSALGDLKYSGVREATLKVLKAFISKVKDTKAFEAIKQDVLSSLDEAISKESLTTISGPLADLKKTVSGMDTSP
ncbi:hypothetical protein HDU96_009454 [Phlyctochytrium bullatum]|nr:hypothetical protein HDU96_009454 [Phlyctochytrium bullatum]